MTENLDINENQAKEFYQVLRNYLLQSNEGQQLITAFEKDPDNNIDLANYLRQRLPEDDTLATHLASALGEGSQFTTVVANGQVDQIINIARLGVLSLTIQRYFYVFTSVKQVVAILITVLLLSLGAGYAVWKSAQPRVMTGDFNIAVAEFVEKSNSSDDTIAPIVSQMIFSFLDSEYQLSGYGNVQVSHDKIKSISGAAEAEALARAINAQVVIYGDVTIIGDQAAITPKFYVTELFRSDVSEISGQHQFALPIEFTVDDLIHYESDVNINLRRRTTILTEFTKGLVYLAADDLDLALEAIENAIRESDKYDRVAGQEVLFLFASQIKRLQKDFEASLQYAERALALNDSYARAYIAQANVYYEQQDFVTALKLYEESMQIEDQPFGSHITEKANLGIGNIYTYQFLSAEGLTQAASAKQALKHFQLVIDAYTEQTVPGFYLQEFAAQANFSSGLIHRRYGKFDEAIEAFNQTLSLTQNTNLKMLAQTQLNEIQAHLQTQ